MLQSDTNFEHSNSVDAGDEDYFVSFFLYSLGLTTPLAPKF
jgi:hypothetical protein